MKLKVTVQYAVNRRGLPRADTIARWVRAVLKTGKKQQATLTVRFVGKLEILRLNNYFRGKQAPTNVLSFASDDAFGRNLYGLGDIVICKPIIKREAMLQRKNLAAHCAHMVVHGVLHLLGHDHVRARDALKMERREIAILASLGYPNPYLRA
jgi:probable rRNA maturation factor